MGTNKRQGAGAGLITTSARSTGTTITTDAELRYQRARAEGVTADRWRGLARGLDRDADHAYTLAERRRLRGLGNDCRARADRLAAPQAVAA